MKNFLKIFVAFLLFFNGIGALFGGWTLMANPDGSGLQLTLELLRHAPFQNYFIPGLILFFANGLFSLFVLAALLFNIKNYSLLVFAQGIILTVWIVVQCAMLQTIHYLHMVYGFAGLFMLASGWMLKQIEPAGTAA